MSPTGRSDIDLHQNATPKIGHLGAMRSRSRPPIRHCPICGIAMQASRSKDQQPQFDTFECLACDTVILEHAPGASGASTPGDNGL